MPELPEVETVRRGLEDAILDQTITYIRVLRRDLRLPVPQGLEEVLLGKTCRKLLRRGKYILAFFDSGPALVLHLGMSGRIRIHHPGEKLTPQKHDHIHLKTDKGISVIYHDPRRFGFLTTTDPQNWASQKPFSTMGPEPLDDWSSGALHNSFTDKSTSVKLALLDQSVVSGLGNIYVCEALYLSKIAPQKPAGTLTLKDCALLVKNTQHVLKKAIAAGGSTLRDYQQTNGALGYFQYQFSVYDRAGQPCPDTSCSGIITRFVQSGRSTYACPVCQK